MTVYRLTRAARDSVDEINEYTAHRWGEQQAAAYIDDLFAEISRIADRKVAWRVLPSRLRLDGFRRSWRSHIIYWRSEPDNTITVVAILHQAMDQGARVPAAFRAGRY